ALHPAIAVRRAAVMQRDRVDHPVAVEPVIAPHRLVRGVRAVPIVRPIQLAGQLALDLQVRRLARHAPRRAVTLEEPIVVGFAGHRDPPRAARVRVGVVRCAIIASRTWCTAGSLRRTKPAITSVVTPWTAAQNAGAASCTGMRSRPASAIVCTSPSSRPYDAH